MKKLLVWVLCLCGGHSVFATSYWLIQQDFVKMGKRELYEKEKEIELQKQSPKVIGLADVENPQYVFVMPLKNISSLEGYDPFIYSRENVLLETCVHFHVFSLHALIEKASLQASKVFSEERPYIFYAIYEIELEGRSFFEKQVEEAAKLFKEKNIFWCLWKGLLAGSAPKYVFCVSFSTKEELEKWSMNAIVPEAENRNSIRSKQTGWMKQQKTLSHS